MLELEVQVELVVVEIQDTQMCLQEEDHRQELMLLREPQEQIILAVEVEVEPIKAHQVVLVQMVELEVQVSL